MVTPITKVVSSATAEVKNEKADAKPQLTETKKNNEPVPMLKTDGNTTQKGNPADSLSYIGTPAWFRDGDSTAWMNDKTFFEVPQLTTKEKPLLEGGKYKNDLYYTRGGNNHQALHTYQIDPVKTPFGNYSFAIGSDYKLDDGDVFRKTVLDLYSSHPLCKNLSLEGRLRTTYSEDNPATQARFGLNFSLPLTDRLKLVNLAYGKEKFNFHGRHTDFTVGNYIDLVYDIDKKWSIIGEVESPDLSNIRRDNLIYSIGVRYKFGK